MRDAVATFLSVERTDGARSVGHSRAFSFIHGLGDPSQLPVGDADVALAWGCQWGGVPVTVPDVTWLQCIMIDVFEADVFLSLGPWPMGRCVVLLFVLL